MIEIQKLRLAVEYDPATGLFRRIDGCVYAKNGWFAGFSDQKGYLSLRVCGKSHRAHRLAWALLHGRWPENLIDHIDHDPANNRLSNLREATNGQNQHNRKKNRGKLLPKGVSYHADMRKRFCAEIKLNGKTKYLGSFASAGEASIAYQRAALEMHGNFAPKQELK